ncbi:MAG TPA: IMP dehydrogenase [Bacteroidia bacterium]|nr:IMP dehydrogenase [Bacteroidia bacterium]HRS57995.1 IMP dehydrogenase [Bacteroidia bacterium]
MDIKDDKFIGTGLAFDDVLVLPAYSEVLPREVVVESYITRHIKINIPLVSAAMDTVTEYEMAIAMARLGGIGIIHKNMSIEKQVAQVRKVKRSESGMVAQPFVLPYSSTVGEAIALMKEQKISGIPIVNDDDKLLGILTHRDIFFEKNMSRKVTEVMTPFEKLVTAPLGTNIQAAEDILRDNKVEKLPVIDEEGKIKGLFTLKDIKKIKDHPEACKDELGRLRVGASIGIAKNTLERTEALINAGADIISIDSAHGNSKAVLDTIREIKRNFPSVELIGGNTARPGGAQKLVDAGVDAVKVGIGPGSICTTRVIAGIGVPQLTAIYDCAKAIEGSGVPIIADGGIRYSGDIVKAIAAGASTIMAGSLFAGVEEAPGETIIYEGRKYKTYRGMGSVEAMKEGSGDRYFQDPEDEIKKLVPEGIVGRVPYKGNLSEVVYQYIGGLKAGMGYCGAKTIADLQKAQFIIITSAGVRESHPHDITIIKEAPNYSPH